MNKVLEFRGRLSRSDKRPANPGRYDLLFQLHRTPKDTAALWSETIRGVEVSPGGFYGVVLGELNPLDGAIFERSPRWLSVRVVRGSHVDDEFGQRFAVLGHALMLADSYARIEARLTELETLIGVSGDDGSDDGGRITELADTTEALATRVDRLEESDDGPVLHSRIDELRKRLDALEEDDGRLCRIEDELEDLVGPDGDVVDLNERMDRIEGRAPDLIADLRKREAENTSLSAEKLTEAIETLRMRLTTAESRITDQAAAPQAPPPPPPTADDLGVVKRGGDVMTGGLTINRGGLEVLSGGITCRGANVTTLEASNLVKAPKMIADALELRGDLTFDSTRRAVQCRMVEGRAGSSRRDGALLLNSRGGAEVVVGNANEAKGMEVHGTVGAGSVLASQSAFAQVFDTSGDPEPGDVVRLAGDGSRVGRSRKAFDTTVVGIACASPGVATGGTATSGRIAVALQGVTLCKAEADSAPIAPGDLLAASDVPGHARAVDDPVARQGAIVGKALEPLASGTGIIHVLVFAG